VKGVTAPAGAGPLLTYQPPLATRGAAGGAPLDDDE